MKRVLLRPSNFLGRSKNVAECEEDITASIQFFKDVVRTWLSVKRVLLRPSNFQGRSKNVAECEEGITASIHFFRT